jgi:hypothetical protein
MNLKTHLGTGKKTTQDGKTKRTKIYPPLKWYPTDLGLKKLFNVVNIGQYSNHFYQCLIQLLDLKKKEKSSNFLGSELTQVRRYHHLRMVK